MDRRLKIMTIAISMAYVLMIGISVYHTAADFVYGFKIGFNEGQMFKTGEKRTLSVTGGTFFLSVKPENGLRTFPSLVINRLDGQPLKAEFEKIVVETGSSSDKLPQGISAADIFFILLSFFTLFVMILIPVQTIRVVRSITGNKIFDPANIRKLRMIGYALLAFYLACLIMNFIHYRTAADIIGVEGYSLQLDWGNAIIVLLGFIVLMFAELLKVSVQLKEEQDLTV